MSSKISSKTDGRTREVKGLTSRQRVFVAELQAEPTLHATEAARRAGYKNPSVAAQKLMQNEGIRKALSVALTKRVKECELRAEDIDQQLLAAVEFDLADIFEDDQPGVLTLKALREMVDKSRKCITGVKVKQRLTEAGLETEVDIKWMDKIQAAKLLYQRMGLLESENKQGGVSVNLSFLAELRDSLDGKPVRPVVDSDVIDGYVNSNA